MEQNDRSQRGGWCRFSDLFWKRLAKEHICIAHRRRPQRGEGQGVRQGLVERGKGKKIGAQQ